MIIAVAVTNQGTPQIALDPVPTVRVYDLSDGSVVVNDLNMVEVGGGFYKYDFTGYKATKDYAIRVDAGVSFSDVDRYYFATDFAKSPMIIASKRIVNNKLEIYTSDGVIASYDLKNADGDATNINVYDAQENTP